ncbi:hypothetical protein GC167_04960 [bacterium]|nr:hypothetical protein [bacterium]
MGSNILMLQDYSYLRSMRLEHYIADLLFRHDCVVVPGFGGFVARRIPAGFDPVTQVFRPAHKSLGFNPQLLVADGLLVDYVSRVNRLSYELAAARVDLEVRRWKDTLNSGSSIALAPLGRLYSESGRWVFMPQLGENFERSSFGLGWFHSTPAEAPRLSEMNWSAAPVASRPKVVRPAFAKPDFAKISKPLSIPVWGQRAALWVPLLGLGLAWSAQQPAVQSLLEGSSAFRTSAKPVLEELKAGFDWPVLRSPKAEESVPTSDVEDVPKPGQASSSVEGTVEVPRYGPEPNPLKPTPSEEIKNENQGGYVIVIGAFQDPDNAEKLVQSMEMKGLKAAILPLKARLHRVVLVGFSDRTDAEKSLVEVRAQIEQSAWILAPTPGQGC